MERARQHLFTAAGTLVVLVAAALLAPLAGSEGAPLPPPPAAAGVTQPPPRLTAADRGQEEFFVQAPAGAPAKGLGLFQTDYFKPPPPPPKPEPKPEPKPPTERTVAVVYRGILDLPPEPPFAYVVVDEKLVPRAVGDTVAGDWKIERFDADQLVLVSGDRHVEVRFNQRGVLKVPLDPEK